MSSVGWNRMVPRAAQFPTLFSFVGRPSSIGDRPSYLAGGKLVTGRMNWLMLGTVSPHCESRRP